MTCHERWVPLHLYAQSSPVVVLEKQNTPVFSPGNFHGQRILARAIAHRSEYTIFKLIMMTGRGRGGRLSGSENLAAMGGHE